MSAPASPTPSDDTSDPTPLVSTSHINPSDVPEFERDAASGVKLSAGNLPSTVAHVDPNNKNPNLAVDTPSRFTSSVEAHELMHDVQNAAGASNPVDSQSAPKSQSDIDKIYGYGGTDGLDKVMKAGGVSKLNDEQQASIPQTYMKEYVNAEKAGDAKALDRLNQVYEPAIRQLRNMANTSKDSINTTPDAPAGAPAALLGIASPVKGMLSNSTKSVALKGSDVHNPPQKAVAKGGKSWYTGATALKGK
jgi:hypothetical protein